jgi:hypothetical protein
LNGVSGEKKAWIETIVGPLIDLAQKNDIFPSVMLAQAIVESAWGQSTLAKEAHNYFGIKATPDWYGETVTKGTDEYDGHRYYHTKAVFRKYPNMQSGLEGYVHKIKTTQAGNGEHRYLGSLRSRAKNYAESCRALQRGVQGAGWATSPEYAESLIKIIREKHLDNLDNLAGTRSSSVGLPRLMMFDQSRRNDGLFKGAPWGAPGCQPIGSVKQNHCDHCAIVVERQRNFGGVLWFGGYLDTNKQIFVWFDSKAVIDDHTGPRAVAPYQAVITNQEARNDGLFYDKPWNYHPQWAGNAKDHNGQTVTIRREWTTPDRVTWVEFDYRGRKVWLDKSGLAKRISKLLMFEQGHRDDGLFAVAPWGMSGCRGLGSVKRNQSDHRAIYVEAEIIHNGVTWYGGYLDTQKKLWVWFDSEAVVEDRSGSYVVSPYTVKIDQRFRDDGLYAGKPWEYRSDRVASAKSLHGRTFKVTKRWDTPDGVTWMLVNVDGRQLWLDTAAAPEEVSRLAWFNQDQRDDGLFIDAPWGMGGCKGAGSVKQNGVDHRPVVIERQMTYNGVTWGGGFIDTARTKFRWFDLKACS